MRRHLCLRRITSSLLAATLVLPASALGSWRSTDLPGIDHNAAKTAIIAGVAGGAAVGVILYLRHRRNSQKVALSPHELKFSEVPVGKTSDAAVLVHNRSKSKVIVRPSGEVTPVFHLQGDRQNGVTVNPGASATFKISFAPAAAGKRKDRLSFSVSDTEGRWSKTVTVKVSGTGIPATVASAR